MEENEGLEEILINLREEKKWSYAELAEKINNLMIESEIYDIDENKLNKEEVIVTEEYLKKRKAEKEEAEEKLREKLLSEKDVKKWEYGITYPDLDMLYRLSELYDISCDNLVKAKNISYHKGFPSTRTIKWICYYLNVSIWVGFAINILIIALAFFIAIAFFRFALLGLAKRL